MILPALLAVGCTPSPAAPASPTVPASPPPARSPTATLRPTVTPRPTWTPRPTSTPTRTPMPVATLDTEGMHAFVAGMLETNGGCELPCWWGVTPGETAWSDMVDLFTGQGIQVWEEGGGLGLHVAGEPYGDRATRTSVMAVAFEEAGGLVVGVDVASDAYYEPFQEQFISLWQRYALQPLLARHGEPSQVVLNLTVGAGCVGGGNFPDYGTWTIYEEQGIAVRHAGLLLHDHEGWLLCPLFGHVKDIRLRLAPAGAGFDLVDLEAEAYDAGGPFSVYGPLAELSDVDVAAFYDAYVRPDPQVCIAIPRPDPADEPSFEEIARPPDPPPGPDAESAFLADMLVTNGGCELPCWWGITPGVTPWEEARQRFLAAGKSVSSWWVDEDWGTRHQVGLFGRRGTYPFAYVVEHVVYEREGVVSLVGVHGHAPGWPADVWSDPERLVEDWDAYTLDRMLARFGAPSQVLLHYWSDHVSLFSVALVYEERGVLVETMGLARGEEAEDRYGFETVHLCPGRDHVTDVNVWLWPPGEGAADPVEVLQSFGGGYLELLPFQSTPTLEEATGMAEAEFVQLFQDPNADVCLEAAVDQGDYYP